MKWCCVGFSNNIQMAGQRGFAIIVDTSDASTPQFVIQHRAIDMGFQLPFVSDVPISVVTETRIQFCPWCGVSLSEFYAKSANEISRSELRVRI